MCCSESKTNQINVELPKDNVEVRKGRWLRVIHQNPDAFPDTIAGNAIHSSVVRVNSWLANGIENNVAISSNHGHSSNERTNKIVVFFIHGVGGCSDIWHEQIDYFSKMGYAVVAPDILGHGGSSTPRDQSSYTFSELATDMFAIFDRYRSEKKNILVGHSYG